MSTIRVPALTLTAVLAVGSSPVWAAEAELQEQIEGLETQVQDLRQQVEANNMDTVSKVHLAGYGAATYTSGDEEDDDRFSQVLFAPIFHYQYDDLLLFEGELEFEIEDSGETEVALEYVTLDLLLNDYVALVGGKFLSPLGQFRQNLHPSWINKMPTAPVGFGHGGAAPLSDVGLQARGGFPVGGSVRANYAAFVANGPTVLLDGHGDELEIELESEGATSDADGNEVFGGRIGVLPLPALEVGFSGAFGKVGVAEGHDVTDLIEGEPDRDYTVLGADVVYQWKGLELRGEYIEQSVDSDSASEDVPGELEWQAWYTQAAYRLPGTNWEGVFRYGDLDTPNDDDNRSQWAVGVNYLFASNVQVKAAFESDDFDSGDREDDERVLLQMAYGF